MFDARDYMARFTDALKETYGDRLLYVGLQGSYRRGEATEDSDMDVMVVLDELRVEDLNAYRRMLASTPSPEKSCGFICGRADLAHWNACEICQLVHETQDVCGMLQTLVPAWTDEDVRTHVKIGVGNLYHEICHRYIHRPLESSRENLRYSYKGVFYILQNLYYLRTGRFVATKRELLGKLDGIDRDVLQTALSMKEGAACDFDKAYSLLFRWCQETLRGA